MPKESLKPSERLLDTERFTKLGNNWYRNSDLEQFDISGKIDENNPIFKFYEKEVSRFLKNKYGAKLITDQQGVKWMEIDVQKSFAQDPIQAFGKFLIPASILGAGSLGVMDNKQFESMKQQIETQGQNFISPTPGLAKEGDISVAKGTNYDPFGATQTKPNPDGKGAAGVTMTDSMIAVSRLRANSSEPIVPYGTIIRIDGKEFLVADIKNQRFFGSFQFDFARPGSGDDPIPELNKDFDFEIIELGKGRIDAREKAKRFQ